MESFYGGRQGASVVIKARFKYITSEIDTQGYYIDPYYQIAYNNVMQIESENERETALNILAKETMVDCFKDVTYKDVWYHEYCIIDNPNRNNKNNGKIYRRTLKKSDDVVTIGGVAEYIGQIVGPAGSAPQLADVTNTGSLQQNIQNTVDSLGIDDVLSYRDEQGNLVIYDVNAVNSPMGLQNFGSDINYIPGNSCGHANVSELQEIHWCLSTRTNNSENNGEVQQIYICKDCGQIKVHSASIGDCSGCRENDEEDLWMRYLHQWVNPAIFIPWEQVISDPVYMNEYGFAELNANIQQYIQHGSYGWYNLRKGTEDQDLSLIYLGFDIPYYITEFEGSTLPYTEGAQVLKTVNTNNIIAPYYEKYNIQIPRGITGAWIENLRWITTPEQTENNNNVSIYNKFDSIVYEPPNVDETDGNNGIDQWKIAETNSSIEIAPNITVWLVDFCWVDNTGESHRLDDLYIGLYKNIKRITLSQTGTLTIEYSDGSTSTEFPNAITWISSAKVENDYLKINFNNNNTVTANINQPLYTITSASVASNGTLSFGRASGGTLTAGGSKIKWIDTVTMVDPTAASDAGHLKIHFNTSAANTYAVNQNLNIYKTVNYDNSTGVLTLENTNSNLSITATIRTVQEGLFVESKSYQVSVSSTASFDIIETAIDNYLQGLTGDDAPDKTRAQIITVEKGTGASAETEKTIAYWNTRGNCWEILGDTVAANGGSGSGAALDPLNTSIRYDIKSMLLNTMPLNTMGTLTTPWKTQHSAVSV